MFFSQTHFWNITYKHLALKTNFFILKCKHHFLCNATCKNDRFSVSCNSKNTFLLNAYTDKASLPQNLLNKG